MIGLRKIVEINARVLMERTPPGCIDALTSRSGTQYPPLPEGPVAMAFAENTGAMLERLGIAWKPGAGGVEARISGETLARLEQDPQDSEAASLRAAIEQAYQGWARNRYIWKAAGLLRIELGGCPKIMGILNVTPDSFSDGGLYQKEDAAVAQAEKMIDAGAEIIDVGGESTRPGAEDVTCAEEIERTAGVIRRLRDQAGAVISIDTTKSEVAAAALDAGASIINDISGLTFDDRMIPLAAERKAGVVIMHIKGRPRTMQDHPVYEDAVAEVSQFLRNQALAALEGGIDAESIVLDPGIGFGKRFEDNLAILSRLGELRSLGFPLLVGCSRKSFLGHITQRKAGDRILETTVTSTLAAAAGVQVVRVHDVPENRIALKITEAILSQSRLDPA